MSEPDPRLLCPMCLQVTPAPVSLPCGHTFCLTCLQAMDQGLDRHCCSQCRREYHPYDYEYDSCNFPGSSHFEAQFGNEEMRQDQRGSLEKKDSGFQSATRLPSAGKDEPRRDDSGEVSNQKTAEFRALDSNALEKSGSSRFQHKSSFSEDSELFDYLKSKMVDSDRDLVPNVTEKMPVEEHIDRKKGFQSQNAQNDQEDAMAEEMGLTGRVRGDFQSKSPDVDVRNALTGIDGQNILAVGREIEESVVFQNKNPMSEEDGRKMAESKSKLSSQVTDLTLELEKAEGLLRREQQYELSLLTANAKLRESASKLVGDVAGLARHFSEEVMKLMEQEFSPGEAVVRNRVANASEWTHQVKKALQGAESLLKEQDVDIFTGKIEGVQSEIEKCDGVKGREEDREVIFDLAQLCPELERLSSEFRDQFGQVQRSLRSAFNPSEVTFDPETLHSNLSLSDDMKSVKFSAKKQQYTPSPKRFSSFFQVLSSQSFGAGVHRWEVELESAPWILGVCVESALPRAGLPSALETCPLSWALMWSNNLLTAFERSRSTPLKKTSEASRRLQVVLDREKRALSFVHLGLSGRSLIHKFTVDTEEPLHLAYRMLSGDPKGRVTICS